MDFHKCVQKEKLRIKLKDDTIFECRFVSSIRNVVEVNHVKCIYPITEEQPKNVTNSILLSDIESFEKLSKPKAIEKNHEKNIKQDDFWDTKNDFIFNLRNVATNYVAFTKINKDFFNSYDYINQFDIVGIEGKHVEIPKRIKMSILIISTRNQVFVYDLKLIGHVNAFESGLKKILESNNILKILHNSVNFAKCLKIQHGIVLNNFVDIMYLDNKENPTNERLSEKVFEYMKIPLEEMPFEDSNGFPKWDQRPMLPKLRESVANKVVFLIPLYLEMLKRILCTKNHDTSMTSTQLSIKWVKRNK